MIENSLKNNLEKNITKLSTNKNSFAPLFLIPVSLEKGKLNIKRKMYEYKISYSGQSIVSNLSLKEKLKNESSVVCISLRDCERLNLLIHFFAR